MDCMANFSHIHALAFTPSFSYCSLWKCLALVGWNVRLNRTRSGITQHELYWCRCMLSIVPLLPDWPWTSDREIYVHPNKWVSWKSSIALPVSVEWFLWTLLWSGKCWHFSTTSCFQSTGLRWSWYGCASWYWRFCPWCLQRHRRPLSQTLCSFGLFCVTNVSTIVLHHAVQTNVLVAYIRSHEDTETNGSGGEGFTVPEPLSQGEKSKVIEKYLADLYERQKTGTHLSSHDQDMSSVNSSVSMSELSLGASHEVSTISAQSKLRQRRAPPKKKFLTQEKSLSVDTSVAGQHHNT